MRPLAPKGGNDLVYTPLPLAKQIIDHFSISGKVLDPCRGKGAFYDQFPTNCQKDWCEILEDKDFLSYNFGDKKYDFVISNPPWSQIRPFLQKSMEVSNNVIFLCLVNAFFMKARLRDIKNAGFGFKEILFLPTPAKDTGWPQTGFALGAILIQKNYVGQVKFSNL